MAQEPSPMTFLTVQEVADIMRVSSMTVYRMVHSGDIPAIRFGRSFRIPQSAVTNMMGKIQPDQLGEVG
jgi:excisionase family DNA binding protein